MVFGVASLVTPPSWGNDWLGSGLARCRLFWMAHRTPSRRIGLKWGRVTSYKLQVHRTVPRRARSHEVDVLMLSFVFFVPSWLTYSFVTWNL